MNKLEEKQTLLKLSDNPLLEILRGKDFYRGRKLRNLEIKKAKKVNLNGREVYFFEAKYNRIEVKYTLLLFKNEWTLIKTQKDKSPESDWDWRREIVSHSFPERVGDLRDKDEVELLADFVKIRELLENLIAKYGR